MSPRLMMDDRRMTPHHVLAAFAMVPDTTVFVFENRSITWPVAHKVGRHNRGEHIALDECSMEIHEVAVSRKDVRVAIVIAERAPIILGGPWLVGGCPVRTAIGGDDEHPVVVPVRMSLRIELTLVRAERAPWSASKDPVLVEFAMRTMIRSTRSGW